MKKYKQMEAVRQMDIYRAEPLVPDLKPFEVQIAVARL
jgi:hypothetical protein